MKYSIIGTWNMSFNGCKKAAELLNQDSALDKALLTAINDVEDNPEFHSVGYGGLPDITGVVCCDAAFMNGDTLRFGAVADLKDIRNPINVAEKLSHEEKNNFLVSKGAQLYALNNGFEKQMMLTPEAKQIYEKAMQSQELLRPYHDTVCFIGMKDGHMLCGCSTSGLFMKEKGRVGDSPICGSGYYVDSTIGGCCATGLGEDIARGVLSHHCVMLMASGLNVQDAVNQALEQFEKRLNGTCREVSLIAMDKDGNIAAATNTDFAYSFARNGKEPQCVSIKVKDTNSVID